MRDVQRIDEILTELRIAWIDSPDQRLGQLLANVARDIIPDAAPNTLFNIEDDRWTKALRTHNGPRDPAPRQTCHKCQLEFGLSDGGFLEEPGPDDRLVFVCETCEPNMAPRDGDGSPRQERMSARGRAYGEWICLEWYDGPLSEIALVTFDDGHKLAEIKAQGGWRGEDYRVGFNGEQFHVNHMRFDRATLVALLSLIDGRPVKDYTDRLVASAPPVQSPAPLHHITSVEVDVESLRRGGSSRSAACGCGWRGPERSTMAVAADDALAHEEDP